MARMSVFVALALLASGLGTPAHALDTTEPFELGVSNAEVHLGYGGVGLAAHELSHEFVLGYGLHPRFSGYVASCVAVDPVTFRGGTDLCFGLLGTALDTEHFDLDLMLDAGAFGRDLAVLNLGPAVEFNFDRDPDMSSWGIYFRSGIVASASEDESAPRRLDWGLNPGAYLRLGERLELLVEYDANRRLDGPERAPSGVAVGLNAVVHPAIELVTQIRREGPLESETPAWSFGLGFVATIPRGD